VDNILVSMPPPVLESLLTRILGDEGRPCRLRGREGDVVRKHLAGKRTPDDDLYGREPQTQAATDGLTVAEAAAKAIYCARAYAGRSARVSFAPAMSWGRACRGFRAGRLGGRQCLGFLGKTVRFQSPYPEGGAWRSRILSVTLGQ